MSNVDMAEAVRMLAADKGISVDTLLQVLADALVAAYKRRQDAADEAEAQIDVDTMDIRIIAYDIDEDGNWVNPHDDTPEDMGRIAAQTFRQVLNQRIREAERDKKFEEYANREGDIVTGIIQQTDSRYTLLDLGKVEALLPQAEQVPFERPAPGDRVKAYIVEVRKTPKGPQIVISRTHPGLIKRLFELEVPEIADGIVEIKACAREPGHRTKIAVWSNDHNVDPVGACVGARGARVRMVVNELRGEKIDIVPFSEDLPDFVAKALSPAKVKEVRIHEDINLAEVIVPDFQLSLAIGKEGQNARLAARLTGLRVEIKSESQLADEEAGVAADDGVEYAEGEWVANPETGTMEWHAADGSVVSEAQWSEGGPPEGEPDAAPEADATETVEDTETVETAETGRRRRRGRLRGPHRRPRREPHGGVRDRRRYGRSERNGAGRRVTPPAPRIARASVAVGSLPPANWSDVRRSTPTWWSSAAQHLAEVRGCAHRQRASRQQRSAGRSSGHSGDLSPRGRWPDCDLHSKAVQGT